MHLSRKQERRNDIEEMIPLALLGHSIIYKKYVKGRQHCLKESLNAYAYASSFLVSHIGVILTIFGSLDEEPIRLAHFLLLGRAQERLDLLDQASTLVVVRLLLLFHDILVSLRDFGDEDIHHNDEHDQGSEEEEEFCGSRHSGQIPLHVEFSQAEQVLLFEIVNEIFLMAVCHDEEGAAECGKNDEVEQKERPHIQRDFHEHIDKETSRAEDAQEVEDLDPHEEAGNSLQRDSEFIHVWASFIISKRIGYDNQNDQNGWNNIRVVPEVRVVLVETLDEFVFPLVLCKHFLELFMLLVKEEA